MKLSTHALNLCLWQGRLSDSNRATTGEDFAVCGSRRSRRNDSLSKEQVGTMSTVVTYKI